MEKLDCVVVGAGVVGLAVAREMALQGHETVLLEREASFGTISSSRNSEVIHAGIYYPKDSLKAKLCVEGNRMLYEYCRDHQVGTQRYGKLIVASDPQQIDDLHGIFYRAQQNGAREISLITAKEAITLEPDLRVAAAIWSKTTGIVDSHVGGADAMQLQTKYLINCAGMSAPAVAQRIEGIPTEHIPKAYFAKGNYFSLAGKSPFRHLIYPVPEPGGLGVHLTLDMAGQAKFGPDVEWLEIESEDQINYAVDPMRGERFYAAIRQYWPELKDGSLQADYSGVRAKIVSKDQPAGDFRIDGPNVHGIEGLYNFFGFESPALTSSLAIAKYLKGLLNP
ncbi:MAG: NAD(P)/FAD-dependent oxidoreductase [Polynucleobacter sp.]